MQKYVTPAPGRTPPPKPLGNIVDEEHYKVNVELKMLRDNNYHLEIETWIPEHGWTKRELFLTVKELARLQKVLNQKT